MRLNDISPAVGSKPSAKRLGRGIGSGLGKTSEIKKNAWVNYLKF